MVGPCALYGRGQLGWTCTWLACSPHPDRVWAGVIGLIDHASLDGLFLERNQQGKSYHLFLEAYGLIQELLLAAGQDGCVGSSSSRLLAPASGAADATLRLSH